VSNTPEQHKNLKPKTPTWIYCRINLVIIILSSSFFFPSTLCQIMKFTLLFGYLVMLNFKVPTKLKVLGCPMFKFFLGLPKHLPQKIRLPIIYFFTSLTPFLPFLFLFIHCQKLGSMWKNNEKQCDYLGRKV
jgi:hypothetical protein